MPMKRRISLLIALILALCTAGPAFAVPDNVQYDATRDFLQELEEQNVLYAWRGVDEDKDEVVTITYSLLDGDVTVYFYFEEDDQHCDIFAWDLIEFEESRLNEIYEVCNELNCTYKYCTFFAEPEYFSLSVSMSLIYRAPVYSEICFEALIHTVNIIDEAMETLADYRI